MKNIFPEKSPERVFTMDKEGGHSQDLVDALAASRVKISYSEETLIYAFDCINNALNDGSERACVAKASLIKPLLVNQ